jgi:hypothetical protein
MSLLAVASLLPVFAEEDAELDLGSICPGAAAWKSAHADMLPGAMSKRDQARTLSRPELRKELEERVDADQAARKALLAHRGDAREAARIDEGNDAWLIKLLKENGMPTVDQVGEFGLNLTWLLVQHADRYPGVQEWALEGFRRQYQAGAFSGDELARLTDRVLLHQGKQQRYGTQFDWKSGEFNPKNIGDLDEVDIERGKLGLMPLSDYGCMMAHAAKRLER